MSRRRFSRTVNLATLPIQPLNRDGSSSRVGMSNETKTLKRFCRYDATDKSLFDVLLKKTSKASLKYTWHGVCVLCYISMCFFFEKPIVDNRRLL